MWNWLTSIEATYFFMSVTSICTLLITIGVLRIMDRAEGMLSKMIGAERQSVTRNITASFSPRRNSNADVKTER